MRCQPGRGAAMEAVAASWPGARITNHVPPPPPLCLPTFSSYSLSVRFRLFRPQGGHARRSKSIWWEFPARHSVHTKYCVFKGLSCESVLLGRIGGFLFQWHICRGCVSRSSASLLNTNYSISDYNTFRFHPLC